MRLERCLGNITVAEAGHGFRPENEGTRKQQFCSQNVQEGLADGLRINICVDDAGRSRSLRLRAAGASTMVCPPEWGGA
eukprot:3915834-Pleurochrysis_carterae.AAC.1